MDMLFSWISTVYAALAVAPFITFILLWFLVYMFLRDKKMTTRLTMDVTTLFLLGSVSLMWNQLFHTDFGFWLITLVLLIAFGIIGGYQTHLKGKTDLVRVGRVVWRLSFLGLATLYIVLFVLHVGKNYLFST
ncbi:DUF3397 domain-containing protein [Paenibacillus sp. GCM10023248]|uniref:DUF3397 domain-containing protein n=1 Tax=Bacillales TaxID=1385 RepID=UPI002378CD2D|nr:MULTISPECIES: DUF3397 domain-containing protein [Bacillales]MDD9270014.1 DUF3397 domain-containing protein [Paenibacillus sp. MAHUQ-63]MDR6880147.1 hypothetical protein [Bacillus sp. 3255]